MWNMALQRRKSSKQSVFLIFDDIFDCFLNGVENLIQIQKFIILNLLKVFMRKQNLYFEMIRILF